MGTTELSTLMHVGSAVQEAGSPDLDAIRRRGARLRLRRRLAVAGAGAVAVVLLGGAVGVGLGLRDGGGDGGRTVTMGSPHKVTDLTAYERRALRDVPGSYAVDGTVIVPGTPGRFETAEQIDDRLVGDPRPLGFDGYGGGALPDPNLPEFLHGNPPQGSQVLADRGPAYIGCTRWEASDCVVSVLVRDAAGHYYYEYGLGTERFLEHRDEMEVFTGDDYSGREYHATVIGGFRGADATRVEVTTVDGQTVEATLDRGGYREGATIFWASLPVEAARVVAYDDHGDVVAEHTVRPCGDPVDCEVR